MNDDSIAGYRTVRTLAEGLSSRLVLACPSGDIERDDASSVRVIKRLLPDSGALDLLAEIECLSLVQGAHAVELDDIAAAPDGSPALITHWRTAITLRRVMRERQTLRPGEVITILAPLAAALDRVHRAGVALGNLTMDAVHFDSSGMPFFGDFGSARLHGSIPTPAELCEAPWFQEDRSAYAVTASGVIAAMALEHNLRTPIAELLAWLSSEEHMRSAEWQWECERRLFALGAPEPVRLGPAESTQTFDAVQHARGSAVTPHDRPRPPRTELDSVVALPEWLQGRVGELVAAAKDQAVRGKTILRDWCRPIRKRTWALAAVGALCVALAVVVASFDGTEAPAAVASADGDSSAAESHPERENEGEEIAVGSSEEGASESWRNDLPAEPKAALDALLSTRNECLRDLSIECLEAVSRSDSPAFAADSAHIHNVLNGAELSSDVLLTAADAAEIQRLGDSVLFEFVSADESKPASLLLVKSEAGWRIRSYTLPE
ncbi:hypothetical protein [Salinibacterium sp. NYA9b]